MGPDVADAVRLRDMLDAARTALVGVQRAPPAEWQETTLSLVARELRRIEAAAGRVSWAFSEAHDEIDWALLRRFGTLTEPGPAPIPAGEMAEFVRRTFPTLIERIEAIVPPQAPDDV